MVEYHDSGKNITLYFLTNNHEVSALEMAKMYRNRWQIEVFFKWTKQNLTTKKLWGRSENAVNIHVWTAICTHLIIADIKHTLRSNLSVYETLKIPGISAMDKTSISELLTEGLSNQNFNEQMNLFDS